MKKRVLFALCIVAQVAALGTHAATDFPVVRDKFTVEARQYKAFPFTTKKEGTQVKGRFEAQGGSGNDIEVFLMDGDGFTNWKNGHPTKPWYNSGKVTVGNIDVGIPRGEYYLVFNNAFSRVSNKIITADIHLE
jgi:hypothetical protein